MDQNPTETSVQRPRQDTSGDVKVPMTQDAMMTKTVNASEVCIYLLYHGINAVGSQNKT